MTQPLQRCAHGECERSADEHLWTMGLDRPADGNTMACAEHCAWFDDRRHLVYDHHPITATCGMPGMSWIVSDPDGPGWCHVDPTDWLPEAPERVKEE